MKIKVCGIRDCEDLNSLTEMKVDFVGFIFASNSLRFVSTKEEELLINSNSNIGFESKRVGVFVNASFDYIIEKINLLHLNAVQLHGNETPEICDNLKKYADVIKAFSIDEQFDFEQTKMFEMYCSYFLFDTKGKLSGGNGSSFDWRLLDNYHGSTPFLLSGGIGPDDAERILLIHHKKFAGIDLNSKFELSPGKKNIPALNQFVNAFKKSNYEIPGF